MFFLYSRYIRNTNHDAHTTTIISSTQVTIVTLYVTKTKSADRKTTGCCYMYFGRKSGRCSGRSNGPRQTESAVIAVTASDAAAAGYSSRQLCCAGSAVHVDRFRNWCKRSLPVMQYISVSGLPTYQLLSLPSGLHFSSFPQKF